MDIPPTDPEHEAFWREYLTRGAGFERRGRALFRRLPSDPRCRLCAAPFGGAGAPVMRLLGKRPSPTNPTLCDACFVNLRRHRGGAEIEATFLFADVRGSTALGEGMTSAAFRATLDRFYAVATHVVFAHDGAIDKFVGDEVVAFFVPLMSGPDHASHAIDAAVALLEATGHRDPAGPWLPVGAGVQTGPAWVGVVGEERHPELTALGDTVNTTARLAAAAGSGEVLVGRAAAEAAGATTRGAGRTLDLKGKAEAVDAISVRVEPAHRSGVPGSG